MAGAVMISFSAVFVKWANVAPTVAGFYRMSIGGLLLTLIAFVRRETLPSRPVHLKLTALCGLLFFLDLFAWHFCIHRVGPGLATILANFQVFVLAIYGVAVLGERLKPRLLLAIPLGLSGLSLMSGFDWQALPESFLIGVALGLATALFYGGYIIFLRKLQGLPDARSPLANLAAISLITAFFLGVAAWIQGDPFVIPDASTLMSLSAYGIFCQVIGWMLVARGLPGTPSSLAGLLLLVQPTLSFLWDMMLFRKETGPQDIVGALLMLAAIHLGTSSGSGKTRSIRSKKQTENP